MCYYYIYIVNNRIIIVIEERIYISSVLDNKLALIVKFYGLYTLDSATANNNIINHF